MLKAVVKGKIKSKNGKKSISFKIGDKEFTTEKFLNANKIARLGK